PVSSTGHLILAGHALGFVGPRAAAFEIIIQLGAILAVVWLYRRLLFRVVRDGIAVAESRRLIVALFIAFLPAAIVGLLTHHWITAHLFRPAVVIVALIVGGVAILAIEHWRPAPRVETVTQVDYRTALWIGIAQVCSLIPGVSRSGATIMGALLAGEVARAVCPAGLIFTYWAHGSLRRSRAGRRVLRRRRIRAHDRLEVGPREHCGLGHHQNVVPPVLYLCPARPVWPVLRDVVD